MYTAARVVRCPGPTKTPSILAEVTDFVLQRPFAFRLLPRDIA